MTILDISSDLFKDTQSIESDLFKTDSLESDLFKNDSIEDDLFKDQEDIDINIDFDIDVLEESYSFNIEDLQNVRIENGSLGKSLKEIIESNDSVEVIVFNDKGPAAYWVK